MIDQPTTDGSVARYARCSMCGGHDSNSEGQC